MIATITKRLGLCVWGGVLYNPPGVADGREAEVLLKPYICATVAVVLEEGIQEAGLDGRTKLLLRACKNS